MISSYHNALKKGWCPRCGDAFSAHTELRNGRCPECGWPGTRKPSSLTETEWEDWKKTLREHIRKEQIREKAVHAVKEAIRKGQLQRAKYCECCQKKIRPLIRRRKRGRIKLSGVEAHHSSYYPDQWLNVIWLCYRCHKREHRKNPPQYPSPDVIDVDIENDPALLENR